MSLQTWHRRTAAFIAIPNLSNSGTTLLDCSKNLVERQHLEFAVFVRFSTINKFLPDRFVNGACSNMLKPRLNRGFHITQLFHGERIEVDAVNIHTSSVQPMARVGNGAKGRFEGIVETPQLSIGFGTVAFLQPL